MLSKKAYYLFLLLFFLHTILCAQSPHPVFRNYNTDHGLSSPEVYEVLQDRAGYLWFGTDNGVSCYNGYEFENFGAQEGLYDNVVFYLHEDHWGRIWMLSMSGNLYYYDYQQDSIITFAYNDVLKQNRVNPFDVGFYVDTLGRVYRPARNQGFIRIAPNGAYQLTPASGYKFEISALRVEDQMLFSLKLPVIPQFPDIKAFNLNLYDSFNQSGQSATELFYPKANRFGNSTPNYYRLQQGHYIHQYKSMLTLFQDGAPIWSQVIPEFRMVAAHQARDSSIFLGSAEVGLRRYANLDALKTATYQSYLPGNTISHILEDQDGGFWLTSGQNGVYYLQNWDLSVYDKSSGLPDQYVTAIAIQSQDRLFFGLKNGTILELDIPKQRWKAIPTFKEGGEIYGLHWDDQHNRLWINFASGIYYYEKEQSIKPRQYPIIYNPKGRKFQRPFNGRRIYTNTSIGFVILDPKVGKKPFFTRELGWEMRLFDIHEDRSGQIWAGTLDGLKKFNGDSLIQTHLHPALSSRLEEIDEFSDGRLAFGTKGNGVVIGHPNNFQVITSKDGLTSNMIERLHVDSQDNLWVGTLNGLNKITFEADSSYSIQRFTMATGLPSNEINDIQTWGEQVWVATNRGLVQLPPEKAIQEGSKPPLIEEVRIDGAAVNKAALAQLPYRKNNLKITYITLDFSQSGRINYRYRLLPDDRWNLSTQRAVDYPALPPGQYTFEVQSQNKHGLWSPSSRLSFQINAPFWQRWWFWSSLALLIATLAYLFYHNRLNRLKKEVAFQKELAEKQQEMNSLQRFALRAQMNPHFLSNCLNTIQSFIAKGEKLSAMRYLSNFNRLLRKALDFSQMDQISIEEEIQMLKDYIELEKMRFGDRFQYELKVDEDLDLFETQIPPMLVQPFVENAIIHAFPEEVEQPKITIAYQKQESGLLITVADNGIGIAASKRRKAEHPPSKRKSYGMGLPARRLKLISNGQQEEPVVIEEQKNENGKVTGTLVNIKVGTSIHSSPV